MPGRLLVARTPTRVWGCGAAGLGRPAARVPSRVTREGRYSAAVAPGPPDDPPCKGTKLGQVERGGTVEARRLRRG